LVSGLLVTAALGCVAVASTGCAAASDEVSPEEPAKVSQQMAADGTDAALPGPRAGSGRRGQGAGPFLGRGSPGRGDPERFFSRWDADGDGKVALSELPDPARARLTSADTNRDGVLTRDEMQAFHADQRARFMADIDADGDGNVTDAERAAFRAKRHAERFSERDADGDGALTEAEVGAVRWERLKAADANGDGKVTREEADQALADGKLVPRGPKNGQCSGPGGGPGGPCARGRR
jgi:Ca2+-binding EF-hand superfamily protein